MADAEKTATALAKVSQSPFATITGPLGFGGLVLFWQLQGIHEGQSAQTAAQAQMQTELTVLSGKVDDLKSANDAGANAREKLRNELTELQSRVTKLEAESHDGGKRR